MSCIAACRFGGKLASIQQGEKLKARLIGDGKYYVERETWQGKLPIMNSLTHVPEECLTFPDDLEEEKA